MVCEWNSADSIHILVKMWMIRSSSSKQQQCDRDVCATDLFETFSFLSFFSAIHFYIPFHIHYSPRLSHCPVSLFLYPFAARMCLCGCVCVCVSIIIISVVMWEIFSWLSHKTTIECERNEGVRMKRNTDENTTPTQLTRSVENIFTSYQCALLCVCACENGKKRKLNDFDRRLQNKQLIEWELIAKWNSDHRIEAYFIWYAHCLLPTPLSTLVCDADILGDLFQSLFLFSFHSV